MNSIKKFTCILPILLLAMGCKNNNENQGYNQGPLELPVAQITVGDVDIAKEYTTSIQGIHNVEIRPQVSGYLKKIFVDEGSFVRKGQNLFLIESSPYVERYNNALANFSNVKIEYNRKKELVKSKIVSGIQLEEAEAQFKAAEAQLNSAKIDLDFCTIKAPVDGYISRIPYRQGSLIAPTNADALTVLTDISKINAYFSLSETDFLEFNTEYPGKSIEEKLKQVPPVELLMANGQKYALKGKIDAIDGIIDQNTGSIILRATFDNPEGTLRSGSTGKIVITKKYLQKPLIPIISTLMIQDKTFFFSLDKENKAVQLPLEILGKSGDNFIITSGAKQGDKYVETGFERLQPGTPIAATTTAAKK